MRHFLLYSGKHFIAMRISAIALFLMFSVSSSFSQITEMKWELDYEIYLKLANDSNYTYDIREAFHVTDTKTDYTSDFVFYPVSPGSDYVNDVPKVEAGVQYNTLWSALNAKVGGGWIHFTNCIAYALETQKLDLTSPLMKRPESNWKPSPMTESYKRTKNWEYYVPVDQKLAQKEYKAKGSEGTLGDIQSLPQAYINLFLNTSQKDYEKLKVDGDNKTVAKIDLVKVLLGSNYIGEAQVTYISNMVLESVKSYSTNMLPSVIIFDEYHAAALMSLNAQGYKIENIVFKEAEELPAEAIEQRTQEIEKIITKINTYNQNSFKQRLGSYYQ